MVVPSPLSRLHAMASLALVGLWLTSCATAQEAEPELEPIVEQEPAFESAEWVDPPADPRLLTPEDYERFESLRGETLSKDGSWLHYELRRGDDTRELRLRPTAEGGEELAIPWATGADFSADMRYVAWRTGVSDEEREKLDDADEPMHADCVLMDLADRTQRVFPGVASFAFDADGTRLALKGYGVEGADDKGVDLRILDLTSGEELTLGNVGGYDWCDVAPLLAIGLRTGTAAGAGVQLYDAATGRLRELDRSESEYRSLNWREDSGDLAVLRSVVAEESEDEEGVEDEDPEDDEETRFVVLAWRALDAGISAAQVLDPAAAGLEDEYFVVDLGGARWSEDGASIAVGLRRSEVDEPASDEPAPEESAAEEQDEQEVEDDDLDLPGLQIWHSRDVQIYPQAKARESRDARRTLTGVWHLGADRLVRLDENREHGARLLHDWLHAIEEDPTPYSWGEMFGRPYSDVYVTEVADGARKLLLEKVRHGWPSAYGRYYLSFDGEHYWADDLRTGTRACLTRELPTSFANAEYDTPTDLQPPYGVGGWLADDAAVLLNDRYDVWEVSPDGSGGRRLTDGAAERRIHRVTDLDWEAPGFDPAEPMYFHVRGDWSERQGYARLAPGADTTELLFDGESGVGRLVKAEEADLYLYRRNDRATPPELFLAGPELADARPLTATNAFLDEFLWTRAELVEWTSDAGVPLQGALLYPAGYDSADGPAPMIVYTYEKLSQGIHRWQAPSELDYYNYTVWTQAGYFVLLPDIVYRAREPGPSALDAVVPAVAKVVEMGLADADRVGLVGHSWGGYQAAYLPTRTHIFAASVAGAPLTDFVSFMGQIHWSGGFPETSHWETGQGRMEVPYWEDRDAHFRSSPLEGIPDLQTPMLMMFGDDDGSVDWDQGTQFYNYARRAGKEMVLLVYEGEGHGLSEDANRRDYHRRILEWFGHYLKGETAPAWITEGVAIEDLEDERARLAEPKDD